MKRLLLLVTVASVSAGATIEPIPTTALTLSNFQATATVDMNGHGAFSGFAFDPAGPGWEVMPNGDTWAFLLLGSGGRLWSNSTGPQSISAHASVDYTVATGFHAVQVMLYGAATDDGVSAGESFGATSPCTVAVSGSSSTGNRMCTITAGQSGGTVDAWMYMRSDLQIGRADLGVIMNPRVAILIVHNPEPEVMVMTGIGLIGVGLIGWKRRRDGGSGRD